MKSIEKNKAKPKVSVIMAAYNAEKYISASIESILNQSLKNLELIIINDSSIDKTLNIIKGFMKKDKRIKLINNKKNIYATRSRNKGLDLAKGKYIAIQDSDDISLSKRLEIQANFLDKNDKFFLVGSGAIIINEQDKEVGKFKPLSSPFILSFALKLKNAIYHPTIMFRNSGEKYREKIYYAEDYDFYLMQLSKKRKLINLKNYLVKYRIVKNSVSREKSTEQKKFAKLARKFYWQRLINGADGYYFL